VAVNQPMHSASAALIRGRGGGKEGKGGGEGKKGGEGHKILKCLSKISGGCAP